MNMLFWRFAIDTCLVRFACHISIAIELKMNARNKKKLKIDSIDLSTMVDYHMSFSHLNDCHLCSMHSFLQLQWSCVWWSHVWVSASTLTQVDCNIKCTWSHFWLKNLNFTKTKNKNIINQFKKWNEYVRKIDTEKNIWSRNRKR